MACNLDTTTKQVGLSLEDRCCTANQLCTFDGTLRNVKAEPIYVQKVYDAALFNLQALRTISGQTFCPALGENARIIKVLDIRCRKFFNPNNINDVRNLRAVPTTTFAGGEIVEDGRGNPVKVIGPDGIASERIIFTDTTACDEEGKGTPVFGTQNILITGNVVVEIDVIFTDDCDHECKATLTASVPIGRENNPILLTNFFELCIPSVFDTAFLPRFTEFCNIACEARLATNSIRRDIMVDSETGIVRANLIITLCVTCEKKIVVPVQLCVLSTGFVRISPEQISLCETFPQLFPDQIDEKGKHDCE